MSRGESNKAWRRKKKKEFEQYKKTLSCEICKENHPQCLEFHHTDPSTKKGNISDLVRDFSTKRLMEEINKCVVLCANCHRKQHH